MLILASLASLELYDLVDLIYLELVKLINGSICEFAFWFCLINLVLDLLCSAYMDSRF